MGEDFISQSEHRVFAELMESENQRLHEADQRSNERLSALEEKYEMFVQVQSSMEKMEAVMQSTLQEIEKQGKRLERLEVKDGEMWHKVVGYSVTAIVGIVIGFVFKQLGM